MIILSIIKNCLIVSSLRCALHVKCMCMSTFRIILSIIKNRLIL
jgi:hypothetical protein